MTLSDLETRAVVFLVGEAPRGPIGGAILPPGTPRWGHEFTRALRQWHDRVVLGVGHGEVLPYRDHTIDLDPG